MLFSCMKTKMESDSVVATSASCLIFSNALYKVLARTQENILYSPISIHANLSLLYQGADGNTSEQLENVLYLSDKKILSKGYQNLFTKLKSEKNIQFYIANKIFVRESYRLKDSFNFLAKHYFFCGIELINFIEKEKSIERINQWFEKKTNNNIRCIVGEDNLDPLTRMALINGIYFKGDWLYKFDISRTKKENFHINESEIIECDMMYTENIFGYNFNEDLDVEILNLPYKNQKFSLIIILPRTRGGIKELEKKLKKNALPELCKSLHLFNVIVSIPKFKFEETIYFNTTLAELGLGSLFSNEADFSNMSDNSEGLYVNKIIQKVLIDVGEEDTNIATTSESQETFVCNIAEPTTLLFKADRPFLFSLLYHDNRVIFPLLAGAFKGLTV